MIEKSWKNFRKGRIMLLSRLVQSPSLTFLNMLTMWFCGSVSKNIPPYRMLRQSDVRHLKEEKQKVSNMKYLVKHVLRAAVFVNDPELEVRFWTPKHVIDLYDGVKHIFAFPCLTANRKRRHDMIGLVKDFLWCARAMEAMCHCPSAPEEILFIPTLLLVVTPPCQVMMHKVSFNRSFSTNTHKPCSFLLLF